MSRKQAKKILAIDLDDQVNSIVYISVSATETELIDWQIIDLFNIPAEEKEKYLLASVTNFLKEKNISLREVYASINGPAVYFSRLALPSLPLKEIPDALNWQLKDKIPFPIEDVVFDYELIKETTEADGAKKIHLVVALALKKEIEKTCGLLEKAGLRPVKINLSAFCILNLISSFKEIAPQKIYAVLGIGWQRSLFSFYQSGKLIFSRPILVGINNFVSALQTSIVYSGAPISLSDQEARQVVKEIGLPQDLSKDWKGLPYSQILVLMRPELEKLAIELERSLGYFFSNFPGDSAEKIFVTGAGMEIEGIVKFLSQNLKTTVETLPIRLKGVPTQAKQFSCIVSALGNALGPSRKVNLAPRKYRRTQTVLLEKILSYCIITVSTIFLISFILLALRIQDYQKRTKFLKRERQTIDNLISLNAEVKALEQARDILVKNNLSSDWILKEISRIMPAKVILTNLGIKKTEKIITATGIITDSPVPENTLISFMRAIEESRLFKGATLNWIKKDELNRAEFKLTFNLR